MSEITINPEHRMSKSEAEAHEKAIVDNIDDTGMRLLKIREEHGYEALGFKDFTAYSKSIADRMSIGKIYHLLHQAEVNSGLSEYFGRDVHLPVRHALVLKDLEPEQRVEVFEAVTKGYKKGDPKPSEKLFARIANKFLGKKKKAAAKATRDDDEGWTADDLKKDQELADSFLLIEAVYGPEDTNHIRNGTIPLKRADVLTLAKLPKERMQAIQDLFFETHWTPKQCIEFLNTDPDDNSTVEDLKHHCLTTKGKYWSGEFDGFTVSIKHNKAAKR
jgi:hypothetical protein